MTKIVIDLERAALDEVRGTEARLQRANESLRMFHSMHSTFVDGEPMFLLGPGESRDSLVGELRGLEQEKDEGHRQFQKALADWAQLKQAR